MWRRALVIAGLCALPIAQPFAQPARPPTPVESVSLTRLTGLWYAVAAFGSWPHRRCTRELLYRYETKTPRELTVEGRCATVSGVQTLRGRLRLAERSGGHLRVRFAPRAFLWLPIFWSDHWILALDDDYRWYVAGDDLRERLAILSRTVSLDEASLAAAIAAARSQGYDVDRLVPIRQRR